MRRNTDCTRLKAEVNIESLPRYLCQIYLPTAVPSIMQLIIWRQIQYILRLKLNKVLFHSYLLIKIIWRNQFWLGKEETFTADDLLRLHWYHKDLVWQITSGYLNIWFVCGFMPMIPPRCLVSYAPFVYICIYFYIFVFNCICIFICIYLYSYQSYQTCQRG